MAASHPAVFASLPSASLFTFPPSAEPSFLPPPPPGSIAYAPPFSIPDHIYQAALDPKVPITIAALYAVTAKALNIYNKSTGKRPWGISKTRPFFVFVVLHNVFLAVYSAWTFWGMLGALRRSMVSPFGPAGLAGFVDSACMLNGKRGLGNAAIYDEATHQWQTFSPEVSLASDGNPSRTDIGRIWNEGLAFYGWIFYLSKFYEVLDTFIILAKGKLSSTLQTYHHAGAMMCMWAGMRYMSAPIWMFAFVNAGIHAMMYTYYTLTAFNIRVPMVVKRTLTTLQITQFLVGASYAMAHSFVSYKIPVVVSVGQESLKAASSSPAAAAAAAATAATTTAAVLLGNLKQLIFGADPTVASSAPAAPAVAASGAAAAAAHVTYGERVVPCITTTGETFAIWLNVLYLAPLTYLFVSFFIASYIRRSGAEGKLAGRGGKRGSVSSHVTVAEEAGWDAARGIEREVYGDGEGEAKVARDIFVAAQKQQQTNGRATRNGKTRRG
ncbi:Elongation of fatty acids protein [Pleurostoma richardsiae]|uniref:Elongation of fatty acids protein n=1 Tax=Pleurostoma richardsiae TaxID=41990 RepID=A0AA38VNF3_9PEZI|nr:Elongation of fatty acids protein [Pleurostoma richardsiae]